MEPQEAPQSPPEPGTKPVVERRFTPQQLAAMAGYIPLNTEPLDRFTPPLLKQILPVADWPVILILKPTPIDRVKSMERNSEAANAAARAVLSGEKPEEKVDVVAFGKEVYETAKERIRGLENYRTLAGEEIAFQADPDGRISDECLRKLGWQLLVDVRNRYFDLFNLSPQELEGLG